MASPLTLWIAQVNDRFVPLATFPVATAQCSLNVDCGRSTGGDRRRAIRPIATLPVGAEHCDLNQKIGRHIAVKLTGPPLKNEGFRDWDSAGSGIPGDSHPATDHHGANGRDPEAPCRIRMDMRRQG